MKCNRLLRPLRGAFVLGLVIFGLPADAATPQERDPQKLAQFLLAGMKDGRDRLRTGVFKAQGRVVKQNARGDGVEGEVDIFSAFDYELGLLRFDRTEPAKWRVPGFKSAPSRTPAAKKQAPIPSIPDPSLPVDIVLTKAIGKWVRTPSHTIRWVPPQDLGRVRSYTMIGIGPPNKSPIKEASPFDVRTLGLLYWHALAVGEPFDQIYGATVGRHYVEVDVESRGLHRIRSQDAQITTTTWLDETKDFAPVRLELRYPRAPGAAGRPNEPVMVSEVGYEQVSGVWVPTSYRIEDHIGKGNQLSYEFTLVWESVNQPVPPVYFTAEGFGVPKGTNVIDDRLGKPIITGKLDVTPALPEFRPQSQGRFHWSTVVAAVAGLTACVLGGWSYRSRRRRSQPV